MEFGDRVPGQAYQPRPGSYAVILGDARRVAIVETSRGCFLPGGGAQPGESPETALAREVLEECGCEVEIVRPLGLATEYVFAEGEGYFAKEGSFFQARLGHRLRAVTEPDHRLIWLATPEALVRLVHGSHAWAVSQATTENLLGTAMGPDSQV
jgi:8-oxo-dGTP diphosphatase